jgi:hypothetical protein
VLKSFIYKVINGCHRKGPGDAFASVIWVGSDDIELTDGVLVD